jgi:four helix bundle protein
MKDENIIQEKTFNFAVRIVKAYQYLINEKKEFVLSKQLLRCGTSIGANIEESIGGQSKPDFLYKITISYKEARESIYWIRLLEATGYFTKKIANSLLNDAQEICKIIGRIQLTTKKNSEQTNSPKSPNSINSINSPNSPNSPISRNS